MTLDKTIDILREREVPYYYGAKGFRTNEDEDSHLVDIANVMDLDKDENKLYSAILGTFPQEELLRKADELSATNCSEFLIGKMIWAAGDHSPVTPTIHNEPIGKLLRLFTDKKSGGVYYARKDLRKRYPSQDFATQKKIIRAFLEKGAKEDINWAGRTLRDGWIPGFEEIVLSKFRETRDTALGYVILRHFPTATVLSEAEALAKATQYAYVAARVGNEQGFVLDRTRLSVPDYFYVMAKLGREVSPSEAEKEIRSFLSPLPAFLYRHYGIPGDQEPLLAAIPGFTIIVWALGKLGLTDTLLWLLDIKRSVTAAVKKASPEDTWPAMTTALRLRLDPSLVEALVLEDERFKFLHSEDIGDLPPDEKEAKDEPIIDFFKGSTLF